MAKNIDDVIIKLSKSRQEKIKSRASELVVLEMTLQELRKNRDFSQEQLAEILGIGQEGVSRLEHRPDIRLSTLQNYIRALGGTLRVIADFPDSSPVQLINILD